MVYKMILVKKYEYEDGSYQFWNTELWHTTCVSEKQAISRTAWHLRKQGIYLGIKDIREGCVRTYLKAEQVGV